jgi:hypothetical protein
LGHEFEDIEILQGLARSPRNLFDQSDSSLGVNEGTDLFTPSRGGQYQVRTLGGFRGVVHILNDQKIELLDDLVEPALVDPGM